jgi:thiol-disulfide isomerase/thioredoxin
MKLKLEIAALLIWMISITSCTGTSNDNAAKTEKISTGSNDGKAAVETLPAFALQDVNGKMVNLQSLNGKKLFVNLWASWCPPCRRELPSIEKLARSVDSSKVSFVLISLDDNIEKAKDYILSKKLTLPVYFPMENLPGIFNVGSIPTTFIFNENGELLQRVDGGEDYNRNEYKRLFK